jgi:hypothetical protein
VFQDLYRISSTDYQPIRQFIPFNHTLISYNIQIPCLAASGRVKKDLDITEAVDRVLEFSRRREVSELGSLVPFRPVADVVSTTYPGYTPTDAVREVYTEEF